MIPWPLASSKSISTSCQHDFRLKPTYLWSLPNLRSRLFNWKLYLSFHVRCWAKFQASMTLHKIKSIPYISCFNLGTTYSIINYKFEGPCCQIHQQETFCLWHTHTHNLRVKRKKEEATLDLLHLVLNCKYLRTDQFNWCDCLSNVSYQIWRRCTGQSDEMGQDLKSRLDWFTNRVNHVSSRAGSN